MSRRAQQILGLLALAASLLYLGRLLWLRTASLPPIAWTSAGMAAAAGAVGLYLVCLLAGALAWFLLLRGDGGPDGRPSLRAILAVCALAQAGKYIPGNVGQYFGRAVLARRYGVPLRDSAFTFLVETAGLILAALACGGVLAGGPLGARLALTAAAAVAAPCLFLFGVRRLVPLLRSRLPASLREKLGDLGDGPLPVPSAATLTACLALYALSFCSGGTALHLLARGLFAAPPGGWERAIPAFALAWVAGFVTPGAPGGLGIREALLVAGTTSVYGPGTALSAALALRAVTVLGDALALLAGFAFRLEFPRPSEERMELDRSPAIEGDQVTPRPWSDPVRWLTVPWTLFVFYPVVIATTVFWACLAIPLALLSQRAAFHCGTVWAWCLAWVSLVWVRVEGRENTRPGQSYVILPNHQGDYDVLALYGFLHRQFRWVIKQELRKVPFLGWACAAIGHVYVDRRNSQAAIASLEAAKPRLAGGVSVLFFPEGTRSPDGRLGPFKKGGFVMARQLGFPVLPVSITGSWRILPKNCLFPRPGILRVRIHPPVEPSDFPTDEALMATVRQAIAAGIDEGER